jgi:hypothetical protein
MEIEQKLMVSGKATEMGMTKSVSLAPALIAAAERQARLERRSLSNLIHFALERYLRDLGVWTDDEPEGARERS